MVSLASMVRDTCQPETALNRLRKSLQEDDERALDAILESLRDYEVGYKLVGNLTPFESVLLLLLIKQRRQIECLETVLQRHSQQFLDLYTK